MPRPWMLRARALFESISELTTRRNRTVKTRRSRTHLGILALEDRLVPTITPLGEFRPDITAVDQQNPAVAADAVGNFVVVWDTTGVDTSGRAVVGQLHKASGQTISFRVNDLMTTGDQMLPAVSMADDGSFVVTFSSFVPTLGVHQIYARRFTSAGIGIDYEAPVHVAGDTEQTASSLAVAPDGSLIVAWQQDAGGLYGWDVYARQFPAQGPVPDAFRVNTTREDRQYWPSVARAANGEFAIGWTNLAPEEIQGSVYARRYSANGSELSGEKRLNARWKSDEGMILAGLAALPTGGYAATWHAWHPTTGYDVWTRVFAADLSPTTDDLPVGTATTEFQGYATIAAAPDGRFLVTWTDSGKDGSGWGVYAQEFTADGTAIGGETQLSVNPGGTVGDQIFPRVAADGLGNFVTAWTNRMADGTNHVVVGQVDGDPSDGIGQGRIVEPGDWFDDRASQDPNDRTIRVDNYGNWAIRVSGGGGRATITPVARRAAPGQPDQMIVSVQGFNGGAGDVTVLGHFAGNVEIRASGSIGNVSGETVHITADTGSIGNISAETVQRLSSPNGNIGHVTADQLVDWISAAGTVAGVSTPGDIRIVEAGTFSGPVTAGGYIGRVIANSNITVPVHAGRDLGAVQAGVWPSEPGAVGTGTISGSVTAGSDVGFVIAGGNITGLVQASGTIAGVWAGGSIAGTIEAGTTIGTLPPSEQFDLTYLRAGPLIFESNGDLEYGLRQIAQKTRGAVHAGQDFAGTATATTGDITSIFTGRDFSSSGTATANAGDIGGVSAGQDFFGTLRAGWDVRGVAVGRDAWGVIDAGHDVGGVTAGRHVAGQVTADQDVGSVSAGVTPQGMSPVPGPGNVTATIDAGRDLRSVFATGNVTAALSAGYDLVDVQANGTVAGDLWAGHNVSRVKTGGELGGTIRAEVDIGRPPDRIGIPYIETWGLIAGTNYIADATAGRDVQFVSAGGNLDGTVHATRNVGSVVANLSVTGTIHADGSITSVEAGAIAWVGPPPAADMSGTVEARVNIGSVQAARDVTGTVKAIFGSIGSVLAGQDVRGTLTTAWDLGAVTAGRDVASRLAAVRFLGEVWAGQDVTSNEVRAGDGPVEVTATRDIKAGKVEATNGSVTLDAGGQVIIGSVGSGGAVTYAEATAKTNLWVASRGGAAKGTFKATDGWVYVWAFTDVEGSVTAKQTASVTAWNDLNADVTSTADGAEVFAGHDLRGKITGKSWVDVEARGQISGEIEAGDEQTFGDAVVRSGGNIDAPINSTGTADVAAAGNVSRPITATEGWLDVVANGDITGSLTAGEEASVWAGGQVASMTIAGLDVDIQAGGNVTNYVESRDGNVSIWTGGDLLSSTVKAKQDVTIEAVGKVYGGLTQTKINAGGNAAVLANGDVITPVEAEWLADVRSAYGEVRGAVTTRRSEADWRTAADSPLVKRLAVIESEIARLTQLRDSVPPGQGYLVTEYQNQINALTAERELHTVGNLTTDFNTVPADRIRGMLATSGLAKEYTQPTVGSYTLANGFVVVADTNGNDEFGRPAGYTAVFEPFGKETRYYGGGPGGPGGSYEVDVSLRGTANPAQNAVYYKLVYYLPRPLLDGETPDSFRQTELSDSSVAGHVHNHLHNSVPGTWLADMLDGAVQFGVRLIPLVGAVEEFVDGNYTEAAISLAGDAAMFLGFGAALKARQCLNAGSKLVKFGRPAAAAIEGSIGAYRIGQGIDAYQDGEMGKAFGHFGDATLRLLGLSAQAVAWLRNKPVCFVAGTLVHTETGPKPIEQVAAGERVWAFDRQRQQWTLAPVLHTVERFADRLVTVRLDDGTHVTGTPQHPVWVIEGEDLAERPAGDHGQDEPAGPTPGRWVALVGLRQGDVVLVREGAVSRVVEVVVRDDSAPVYNFEVHGLHSYAVGQTGLLVHNGDCPSLGGAGAGGRSKAKQRSGPVVETPQGGRTAENTGSGGVGSQTLPAQAPPATGTKPTTGAADRSRHSRDRPRNSDISHHPVEQGTPNRVAFTAEKGDDQALQQTFANYDAARGRGAKSRPGEAVGMAGAEHYMKTRMTNGQGWKYRQTTSNGNADLDLVYFDAQSGTYYVIEAKAFNGRRRPRNISTNPNAEVWAKQGSTQYLDGTVRAMAESGDPARMAIAAELQQARQAGSGFTVVYREIVTTRVPSGACFRVTDFRLE